MSFNCLVCGNSFEREHPAIKVCSDRCRKQRVKDQRKQWKERNPEKIKKMNEDRRRKKWIAKGFSEPPPKKVYPKRIYEDNNVDDLAILNRCRASAGLRPLSEMPMVRNYADQGPKPERPTRLPEGEGNKNMPVNPLRHTRL